MARPRVAEEDRIKAKQLLLGWLAEDNVNIGKATVAAFDLHVQGNTFPGDEFMRLAADALEVAGIGRADPIAYETLLADHLPEIDFRGKEYRKIRFAVMSSAGLRGGLDPDLLDEVRLLERRLLALRPVRSHCPHPCQRSQDRDLGRWSRQTGCRFPGHRSRLA
jgi:hypothetical protein